MSDETESSLRHAVADVNDVVNELSGFVHPDLIQKLTDAIVGEREHRAARFREVTGREHPDSYRPHPRV